MRLIELNSSQYDNPDSLLGYGIPNIFQAYSNESGVVYSTPIENLIEEVFPNPVIEIVNIIFVSKVNQGIEYRLYSEKGDLLFSKSEVVFQGKNQLVLDKIETLSAGNYIIEIITEDGEKSTTKIVVI